MKAIAKERNYDNVFYFTLGQIERNAEKGNYTPQPYDYLTTGRVAREPQLRTGRAIDPMVEFAPRQPKRREAPQQSAGMQAMQKAVNKLAQALGTTGRTQDVRSDAEKAQDREMEW